MDAALRIGAVLGAHARAYRRIWWSSVTVSFLNPIFFLLSIGVLLGTLIDRADPDLGGLGYLEFVAPALLATTAMQTAASVTTYPVMAGWKWWKTYHAVIATPVRVWELVVGVLAWAGARILIGVTLFAVVAAVGGAFTSPWAVLAPFAALLCGLCFAAILSAICSWTENEETLAAIFRFGLVPLFLFSGTFFPIAQLPDWLEPLAWVTPLWHGVDLCRDLASGSFDLVLDAVHVAYLAGVATAAAAFSVRAHSGKLLR